MPALGVGLGLVLILWAAHLYPGGSDADPGSAGYDWSRNFISALFGPTAINGQPNPGRGFAAAALALWCIALGFSFWRISRHTASPRLAKVLEISGIGSAVYALLVATPMHDLMVTIGLGFSLTAISTTVVILARNREWPLFAWGCLSLALSGLSASLYFSGAGAEVLPLIQKVNVSSLAGWILTVNATRLP